MNTDFDINGNAAESSPIEFPSLKNSPSNSPDMLDKAKIKEQINAIIHMPENGERLVRIPIASRRHFPCTDSGNAELFASMHGHNVIFDHKRGRWLIWDEERQRWSEDKQAQVRGLMKATARERLRHALNLLQDNERELRWARNSESRSAIDSALELAKSEVPISDSGEDWDNDPWLLGLSNRVIDLRTGEDRPAIREDRITKCSPIVFDESAKCPRFEDFISELFNGDKDLIGYIQKAIGYSLTGRVDEQCLFACHGDGRNGKSTLLEVLLHILGDYAIDLPFSVLEAKSFGNPPGEGVNLPGTRFAKVVEIREGRRLDEARIKSWTGGDTMTVRPLYRNAFSFHPTHKLWLAFNHKPVISDNSPAMWRRIRMIPFLQKFEGAQRDSGLLDKLKGESSGIMNWAIEGCRRWQKEGLQIPSAVNSATLQYQDESDVLVPFLQDRCVIDPAKRVTSAELWTEYSNWVSENKVNDLSRSVFTDHLKRRNFKSIEVGHEKTRTWDGLELRPKDAGVRVDAGTV